MGRSEEQVVDKQPSSAKDLEDAIKEGWIQALAPAYCRILVESMPRILEIVIKNNGLGAKGKITPTENPEG